MKLKDIKTLEKLYETLDKNNPYKIKLMKIIEKELNAWKKTGSYI